GQDRAPVAIGPHLPCPRLLNLIVSRGTVPLIGVDYVLGGRRVRRQFFFTLNDLGRQPPIGFAPNAFEIVDEHRFNVGRRLRYSHVSRNDGFVDFLFAVPPPVCPALVPTI